MIRDAATEAARWGDADLDTDHLLWAATRQEPVRRLLSAAGRTRTRHRQADRVTGAEHGQLPGGSAEPHAGLSKRALLDARYNFRALGLLRRPRAPTFALASTPSRPLYRALRDAHATPETLREAVTTGGRGGGAGRKPPSDTPTVDQFGTDSTAMAREGPGGPGGRPRPGDNGADRSRCLSRRTKNNPVLYRRARRREDRDRRGHRAADRRRGRAGHAARQALWSRSTWAGWSRSKSATAVTSKSG